MSGCFLFSRQAKDTSLASQEAVKQGTKEKCSYLAVDPFSFNPNSLKIFLLSFLLV